MRHRRWRWRTRPYLSLRIPTSSALKVADITISDDGDLYLKGGTVLDFESNPKLDVTVSVNDSRWACST